MTKYLRRQKIPTFSCQVAALAFMFTMRNGRRFSILELRGCMWMKNYDFYVGTFEDYYYIDRFDGKSWNFEHVTLNVDTANTIFYFIKPDPVNKNRLWFGSGGISSFLLVLRKRQSLIVRGRWMLGWQQALRRNAKSKLCNESGFL